MIRSSRKPGWGLLLVLLLVLSGVAGGLLSGAFAALATGWAGLGVVALSGYLIGRHNLGLLGAVFGIGVLFGGARWPAVLLCWILPVVVGFLVRIAVTVDRQTSGRPDRPSLAV